MRLGGVALGLGASLLFVVACREPTEIRLQIHTNVKCSDPKWHGIAVYTGKPRAEELGDAPVLVTHECDADGNVGSLVVVPSGAKDELVSIRVVAAVSDDTSLNPEDCAARDYVGCIVARRAVRFTPHTSLDVPVELTSKCISQGCDTEHTCSVGSCVGVKEEAAPVPLATGHTVHCGDNNAVCASATEGAVCCLSVDTDQQTTFGVCMDPKDCPASNIVLRCDDDSDCADLSTDAGPGMCMLTTVSTPNHDYSPIGVSLSQCLGPGHQYTERSNGLALCQTRHPCNNNKAQCLASRGDPINQLPGYFWCEVSNNQ